MTAMTLTCVTRGHYQSDKLMFSTHLNAAWRVGRWIFETFLTRQATTSSGTQTAKVTHPPAAGTGNIFALSMDGAGARGHVDPVHPVCS